MTFFPLTCLLIYSATEGGASLSLLNRYLDPDPLLLATTHGGNKKPQRGIQNPRFHALNQAIVQLVGQLFDRSYNSPQY